MSVPVPLGVRIYSHATSLDVWVTSWVSDLVFRSVVPGGFASASFTLHAQQYAAATRSAWAPRAERNRLVRLFNRVQIVDLRSGEVAWEGRIESAARAGDDGWAWNIGCAGAMVSATDITRPVFYADSSLESWKENPQYSGAIFSYSRLDSGPTLQVSLASGQTWTNTLALQAFIHNTCYATNQYLARFSATYDGVAPTATGGSNISTRADVYTPSTGGMQTSVDVTSFGAARTRKTNPVGGASSFTSTAAQAIELCVYNNSGSNVALPSSTSTSGFGLIINPVVIPQRMDRTGALITATAAYGTDYVTVAQVAEDVLGRYLVGGWTFSSGAPLNNPSPGQVRSSDAFIDATDTTQITDLRFVDGATAADILNVLMTVQTNAYWAIWESRNSATNDQDAQRYRFEWATWPAGWGYIAPAVAELDEQPDASDIYNMVWYQYEDFDAFRVEVTDTFLQEWWDFGDQPTAPLLRDNLTRGATVKREGIITNSTDLATQWIADNGREQNAGSVTIRQPIQLYDAGVGSYSGAAQMVDPWMIRPGRLICLPDLPPQAAALDLDHGTTSPPRVHDGTVFKVVATNYDAGDNSCRLELDQVSLWSLPGQILPAAATNVQTIPG